MRLSGGRAPVLLVAVALAALAISPVWTGNPGLHMVRFKDGVLTDLHTGPVLVPAVNWTAIR
jgi:hypothetical protein